MLNGNKRWIGNGDGDYLIVYAKNLEEGKINGTIFIKLRIYCWHETPWDKETENSEQTRYEDSSKLSNLF